MMRVQARKTPQESAMQITVRELMTMVHGMLFGGFFLMACFGVLVLLHRSLGTSKGELSPTARRRERAYLIVMVAVGWAAVLSGAYVVYPWYRAAPPAGVADLASYPQRLLQANPRTAGWHSLGMEWKEHVAWMAPMLMTMVAWVFLRYEGASEEHRRIRAKIVSFAVAAFLAAGVAGFFGAMLNKHAPVQGGATITLTREAR
jgi:hypothetical protein